ncbi:MAG: hypothetical protein H6701_01470 [Myxococcales bacterium]|nr:hypothetical protein [Myxococcales bacterium]
MTPAPTGHRADPDRAPPAPAAPRHGALGVTPALLCAPTPTLDILAAFFRLVPLDPHAPPPPDLCGLILPPPAPPRPRALAPAPPVITTDRLDDDRLRDAFVTRAFVYADWLTLRAAPRPGALIAFHARHRARAFVHDPGTHDRLARLAATAPAAPDPADHVDRYGALLMTALTAHPAPPRPAMRLTPGAPRSARRPAALLDAARKLTDRSAS